MAVNCMTVLVHFPRFRLSTILHCGVLFSPAYQNSTLYLVSSLTQYILLTFKLFSNPLGENLRVSSVVQSAV